MEQALEANARPNRSAPQDTGPKPKGKRLSKDQAERMARDLNDYDASIVGGRLRQG